VSGEKNIFAEEVRALYSGKNPQYAEDELNDICKDKYIVAFVDVLGFSSMIVSDPRGEKFIPLVEKAIEEALHFTRTVRELGNPAEIEYRVFSDNFCFWMPLRYHTLSVAMMLSVIAEFQLALIGNGIFCRGGVALGYHYATEYILYGPALVEAVKLEHSTSHPCIAISQEIIEDIQLMRLPLMMHQYHKIEKNGPWFINYLSKIFYIEKDISLRIIQRHHDIVQEKLTTYRDIRKILSKYKWVADYHNDLVSMIKFKDECPTIA
jgi:hypothetical protein